jgi:transcriptional regulator with XRE-family HTH domain
MISATLPFLCQHKKCNLDFQMITSAQCRAGRALIDWSRDKLAETSKVALRTIVDFERDARNPRAVTLIALQGALESEGVIFIAENGDGPGVRLQHSRLQKS